MRRASTLFAIVAVLLLSMITACKEDTPVQKSPPPSNCTLDGFFCTSTTVTPPGGPPEVDFVLDEICSEQDLGTIDPDCQITVNGNNIDISCDFSFSDPTTGCTLQSQVNLSGTFSDDMYLLTGTNAATITCPDSSDMQTAQMVVEGNRVSGPTAACGDIPADGNLTLTVSTPGGDISPTLQSATGFRDPTDDYAVVDAEFVSGDITYYLGLAATQVTEVPTTLQAECAQADAVFIYTETNNVNSNVEELCLTGVGYLTVTYQAADHIAGTYSISGTTEGLLAEERTIEGGFNMPLAQLPGMASAHGDRWSVVAKRIQRIVHHALGSGASAGAPN